MDHSTAGLRRTLLSWYRKHARDLPWRRTRDPYAIWVSEIMLQQTQVATVIPYYQRFLQSFPTLQALARAPQDRVLRRWAGLGYYSRARNLHAAAKELAAAGRLPSQPEALQELPGIGRYTAGAIASIAFKKPAPLVDGNVIRVLSRLFAVKGDLSRPANQEKIWDLAADLVKGEAPGDWNQALMELGATVCLPNAPRCSACPVAKYCAAIGADSIAKYPDLGAKKASVSVRLAAVLVRSKGRILLERRAAENRFLPGHWGLPTLELGRQGDGAAALAQAFPSIRIGRPLGKVSHSITHHRIRLDVYAGEVVGRTSRPLFLKSAADADGKLISSLFRKSLELGRDA